MTFEITEPIAPYQSYAAALKVKMKQRQQVQYLASKRRRNSDVQRELTRTTTAVLLLECDLMDAIETGRG